MSEDNKQVEQITKEPEQKIEKIKDPKKVQAGKRLAEYHRRAKQALEEAKNKNENEDDENNDLVVDEDDSNNKWMPEISLTTALTLVGISLTIVDLYLRWKNNNETTTKPKMDNEAPKLPVHPSMNELQLAPKPSKIPKIGME